MENKRNILIPVAIVIGIVAVVALTKQFSYPKNSVTQINDNHAHNNYNHEDEHVSTEHEDHNEHGEENGDDDIIYLDGAEMEEFGIEVATAGPGKLHVHVTVPGEVVVNPDRLSHIVPYVPGVVRNVRKKLGDKVKEGEVMAVLDSRELSDLKSSFLVEKERFSLAETTFKREERLWKQNISSEREYLAAKQALAELGIELEAAKQKLHSLGYSEDYLSQLSFHSDEPMTHYEIVAPFDGVVIEKHITMGEAIKDDSDAFVIADLRTVWVNLTVFQKDLPCIKIGQAVTISTVDENLVSSGAISYISPIISEETRTATARIELSNADGKWCPGLFVTGTIAVEKINIQLLIPKTAIQTIGENTVVFVQTDEGCKAQTISIGKSNKTHVEVFSGLLTGQRYVAKGGFELKAKIVTSGLGAHAGHGH